MLIVFFVHLMLALTLCIHYILSDRSHGPTIRCLSNIDIFIAHSLQSLAKTLVKQQK